jgi:hypothetical protein
VGAALDAQLEQGAAHRLADGLGARCEAAEERLRLEGEAEPGKIGVEAEHRFGIERLRQARIVITNFHSFQLRLREKAEGEGFEPSIRLTTDNGFRDRPETADLQGFLSVRHWIRQREKGRPERSPGEDVRARMAPLRPMTLATVASATDSAALGQVRSR